MQSESAQKVGFELGDNPGCAVWGCVPGLRSIGSRTVAPKQTHRAPTDSPRRARLKCAMRCATVVESMGLFGGGSGCPLAIPRSAKNAFDPCLFFCHAVLQPPSRASRKPSGDSKPASWCAEGPRGELNITSRPKQQYQQRGTQRGTP